MTCCHKYVEHCIILKICTDIRLLASMKEIEEPFEKSQIGNKYIKEYTHERKKLSTMVKMKN